jgi:hypothetical protein
MNNFVKAIIYSKIYLFADDALLSMAADTVIQKIQVNMYTLSDWLKFNKLELKVSTSFVFVYGWLIDSMMRSVCYSTD